MKNKVIHYIFFLGILLIMILPVLMMDHETNKKSLLDNEYLPEFPNGKDSEYVQGEIENYINKRIGFREEAVWAYETGLSVLFNKLEHSLYAYGENDHIMGNMEEYIKDYQHLNLQQDAEFVDVFAAWLSRAKKYLEERDIIFLYFLAPDKKTIYPEGMSKNINVYGDVSRTDIFLKRVDALGIPYIYPTAEFAEAKEKDLIYNIKYDTLHWNDKGNFLANKLIDQYMQIYDGNIVPLDERQYSLGYECRDKLIASNFYVYEDVPVYNLKDTEGISEISGEDTYKKEIIGDFEHYINENLPDSPKILILHDSYFAGSAKFYINRYKEVISVHASNYWELQDMVEHYQPSVVLFENVERAMATDFFSVETMKEWNVN